MSPRCAHGTLCRCQRASRALFLAAVVRFGRAAGHGALPELDTLAFCKDGDHPRGEMCLHLGFNIPGRANRTFNLPVACTSWESPIQHAPRERDFWGKGNLLWCKNISEINPWCKYELPAPVQGSDAVVFCVQMKPVVTVVPRCMQGSTCGLRIPLEDHRLPLEFGFEDLDCAVLLMVYVIGGYIARSSQYIHETQLVVIVGLIVGYICKAWLNMKINFNRETFSWFVLPMMIFGAGGFVLPMMIFGAGYTLQKQSFFKYSLYTTALGVVGTVFTSALIFFGSYYFTFRSADGTKVPIPASERALMAAVLASTDSVAPMAFLPSEIYPTLHFVVFGEGIMNDVVSILLGTVASSSQTFPSLQKLFVWLFRLMGTSLFTGAVFGLGLSIFFRNMTELQHGIVQPVSLLFIGNYLCYIVAELSGFSSILSLFVCAVVCGHYTKHSLSPAAQAFSEELAEYLSYCSEAFVFGYFGLSAATILGNPMQLSLELIFYYSMSILISRLLVAGLLSFLVACCLDQASKTLNIHETLVITLAGCMRGTIAYYLIIKPMPGPDERSALDQLLVNTVLSIVLLDCLVLGGLFPVTMKLLRLQRADEIDEATSSLEVREEPGRHAMREAWKTFDAQFLQPVLQSRPADPEEPGKVPFRWRDRASSLPFAASGHVELEEPPRHAKPRRSSMGDMRSSLPASSTGDMEFSLDSVSIARSSQVGLDSIPIARSSQVGLGGISMPGWSQGRLARDRAGDRPPSEGSNKSSFSSSDTSSSMIA